LLTVTHPTADAARKFIRTAGVPSYEGYELQIRELADALDATMTAKIETTLKLRKLAAALDAQAALVKELAGALVSLIEMPSACTSDGDVLENNRRRGAARAALTKYKARAAGMSSGQSR